MKKKILTLLIIPLIMLCFSGKVDAANEGIGTLSIGSSVFSRYEGNPLVFRGGVLDGQHSYFYRMTINGKPVICYGLGLRASSGDKYVDSGEEITDPNIKRAYQYYINHQGDNEAFAILQITVWATKAGVAWDDLLGYFGQAFVKFGFDVSEESAQARINAKYDAIFQNTSEYSGTLTIWYQTNGNRQPVIGPSSLQKKVYACPDNSKSDVVTSCVRNYMLAGHSESTALQLCRELYCNVTKCFGSLKVQTSPAVCTNSNGINEGLFTEVYDNSNCKREANKFGKPLVPGSAFDPKYCKLYCMEGYTINGKTFDYTRQIFPGNIKNAISVGTLLIWPTSKATAFTEKHNIFPLKYSGQRVCHMVMSGTPEEIVRNDYNLYSPIPKYKEGKEYVDQNKNVKPGRYSASSPWGNFTQSKYETLDKIRNNQYSDSQNTMRGYCDSFYAPDVNEITRIWGLAKAARTAYLNAQRGAKNCSDSASPDAQGNCPSGYTKSGSSCTKARDCKFDDWPDKGAYLSVEDAYEKMLKAVETCKAYMSKYWQMAYTYKQVARCNNYDPESTGTMNYIYNFKTDASIEVERYNGKYTKVDLSSYDKKIECVNCSPSDIMQNDDGTLGNLNTFNPWTPKKFGEKVNTIGGKINGEDSNRVFVGKASVSYQLTYAGNKSIKKGNTSVTGKYIGFYIPLDSKNGIKYSLKVFNKHLGHTMDGINATFDRYLNNDYVCHYETTTEPTDECFCPPDTDQAGKNLDMYLKGMTCYEAQEKYCDNTPPPPPPGDDPDVYCPAPYEDIKITQCLKNGYTNDYCVNLLCKDRNQPYRCKNTNGVNGEMDITNCVYTKLAQGITLNKAIDECDALICPLSGFRVIYRTISLENPFPGKSAKGIGNANYIDSPLSVFKPGYNLSLLGRYPGSNWLTVKDKSLVKNHIIYSRKNSRTNRNSDIYNTDKPLYVFTLTTSVINQIRTYNDSHKYDDFKLDCKKNKATACVSEFVHNLTYGLSGGVCQNATSKANFYTCSDD